MTHELIVYTGAHVDEKNKATNDRWKWCHKVNDVIRKLR